MLRAQGLLLLSSPLRCALTACIAVHTDAPLAGIRPSRCAVVRPDLHGGARALAALALLTAYGDVVNGHGPEDYRPLRQRGQCSLHLGVRRLARDVVHP